MVVCFIIDIWRNIYLQRKILYYLNLNRIFTQNIYYFHLDDLKLYPFKNYIHKLKVLDIERALDDSLRDCLPNQLKEISFTMDFDQDISDGFFIESIEKIKYSFNFNREIKGLPKNLKHLKLGHCFKKEFLDNIKSLNKLEGLVFPNDFRKDLKDSLVGLKNLKKLKFGFYFDCRINSSQLPSSLKSLKFQMNFNQIIEPFLDAKSEIVLFNNLKVLEFSHDFNQPIHYLPDSLTHLHFGRNFNQVLPQSLPKSLRKLTFEDGISSFDQDLKSSLVNTSIIYLKLSSRFNYTIKKNQLPISLEYLELGHKFTRLIEELPENITTLSFNRNSYYVRPINFKNNSKLTSILNLIPEMFEIPQSVSRISLSNRFYENIKVSSIPANVKSLEFGESFDYELDENFKLLTIERLIFGSYFNKTIHPNVLPPTLKRLNFGAQFENENRELELNSLPANLEKLKFHYSYNVRFKPFVLPASLKSLSFHTVFNQKFELNTLPNSLTYLKLSLDYDHPFEPNVLPKSLKFLSLGESYQHQIYPNVLPSSLQVLELSRFYNCQIIENSLPSSLIKIKFGCSFNKDCMPLVQNCKNLKVLFFGNSNPILPQQFELKDQLFQFLSNLSSLYIYSLNSNLIADIITLYNNSNNNNNTIDLSNIKILDDRRFNFLKDF